MGRDSLAVYFEQFAKRCHGIAFVQKRGYRRERWTYRSVCETAVRFAGELQSRGIRTGDRVLLWGPSSAEWVIAFLGCVLRGAVAVPMDDIAALDFVQRVSRE